MAMTQLTLVFLGSLATLATIGMFVDFGDAATTLVVTFAAAILWGITGLSAFDVIVRDTGFATQSEPILPVAYLGIGFSLAVGIFGLWKTMQVIRSETETTDPAEMMR